MPVPATRSIDLSRYCFRKAKEVAGKKPKTVVTDGLQAYQRVFKKEFYSRYKKDRVGHIRISRFVDHAKNNIVERLNGTISEREKVARNLKGQAPTVIEGYCNYAIS